MAVHPFPVTDIEGIGPVAGRALNAAGIYYTSDLLRLSTSRIHGYVTESASMDEVEQWRSMACFLELRGMSNQWAEALVKGGVDTLEELLKKHLGQLETLFQHAQGERRIATAPDNAATLEFVKDAAVVLNTGQCMGTVVDPDGNPVPGATVTVGGVRTETDARGRYRLIRIPAAGTHYLKIERVGCRTLFEPDCHVSDDCRAIQVQIRVLSPSQTQEHLPELDEYNGDDLPGLSTYRAVSQSFPSDALRQGDVFRVHELYDSTPHVKLVSIFKAYRAGDLIIRHAKVDLGRFTDPPGKGDLYRYVNEAFLRGANTTRAVELHRTLRRVRRKLKDSPEFSQLDLGGRIELFFKTYNESSIFSRFNPVATST